MKRWLTAAKNQSIVADADAGWSSLVARRAHNPKVGSSNLPPATKSFKGFSSFELNPFLLSCGIVFLDDSPHVSVSVALIIKKCKNYGGIFVIFTKSFLVISKD